MRVSARADYAIRAALELARAAQAEDAGGPPAQTGPASERAGGVRSSRGIPVKVERIAQAQEIPRKFLENILIDLKRAGIVRSARGSGGGYQLAHPPGEVSLADIIRAVEGPIATVRDARPEELRYHDAAEHLGEVWVAVRASLRAVLEEVTLGDVASGELPAPVARLAANPDAWIPHLASFGWVSPRLSSSGSGAAGSGPRRKSGRRVESRR